MSGKDWELKTSLSFLGQSDNYYEVVLNPGEKSEMVFSDMVETPSRGVACLTFRYKKFYSGESNSPPLQVLAWPFKGRPGRVNIQRSSPTESTWIRAQVTFRKIDNFFLVVFRGTAPTGTTDKMMLAIDDVTVTEGRCSS